MGIPFILLYFIVFAAGQAPNDEECALNFDSPVYVCPDELSQEYMDTSDIEVHRHNETTSYMSGKFKFMKAFEQCTVIEMIVQKTTGSRTEIMATHDICDLCSEMHADSQYHKYLKFFEFTECPMNPGVYEIVNFVPNADDLPVNKANEARYEVTFNFYENTSCDCKDKQFIGCLKVDFVIEPI